MRRISVDEAGSSAAPSGLDERRRCAPLLAGARARGMADAFELLGVAAAILIDE